MQEHPKHSDIWCKTSMKAGIYRLNYSPEVPAPLRKQSSELSTSTSVPDPPHFLSSNLLRSLSRRVVRLPVDPQGLGFYTPSSIPMKSDPFWMVMGAPAALSTNMEVYCPACGGRRDGGDAETPGSNTPVPSGTHLQLQQPLNSHREDLAVTF